MRPFPPLQLISVFFSFPCVNNVQHLKQNIGIYTRTIFNNFQIYIQTFKITSDFFVFLTLNYYSCCPSSRKTCLTYMALGVINSKILIWNLLNLPFVLSSMQPLEEDRLYEIFFTSKQISKNQVNRTVSKADFLTFTGIKKNYFLKRGRFQADPNIYTDSWGDVFHKGSISVKLHRAASMSAFCSVFFFLSFFLPQHLTLSKYLLYE